MHFSSFPLNLKPREKAEQNGIKSLTDVELLAIFLRNGSSKGDVLDLSKKIITKYGSLKNLRYSSLKEFKTIHGIGDVKALELLALFEFSSRINNEESETILDISDATKIAYKFIGEHPYESFFIVLLDKKNKIIYKEVLYRGTSIDVSIDPKEVISLALKKEATKFYCFHNHPSGDLSASKADQLITIRLQHYSNLFAINMVAHVIINKNKEFRQIA